MANAVTIRDARIDEDAAIRELTLRAYEPYAGIMQPSAWEGLRGAVLSGLASDLPQRIVALDANEQVVGSVMLFPPDIDAYGELAAQAAWPELRLLAVADALRGQGIGRRLVEECIERAKQGGATALGLHSSDSLAAAIRLYERMGFERNPAGDFQPPGAELVKSYVLYF